MKKIFLAICGLFIIQHAFLQSLTCNLPHGSQGFEINVRKIIVSFKDHPSLVKRNEMVSHIPEIVPLKECNEKVDLTIFDLENNLNKEQVFELCRTLNKIAEVNLASPVLITEKGEVSLSRQILIKLKSSNEVNKLEIVARNNSAQIIKLEDHFPENAKPFYKDRYVLQFDKDDILSILDISSEINASGEFELVEPNFIQFMKMNTNDPLYSNLWDHSQINVPGAWNYSTGSQSVVVSIIDTGVDLDHPDLINNLVGGYDATYNPSPIVGSAQQNTENTIGGCWTTTAGDGHGTCCAGIVAATGNNNLGSVGIAYGCKIMPIRYGYYVNSSTFANDDLTMADAFIGSSPGKVISCSFGGGMPSAYVEQAIDYVASTSTILAASGNNDSNGVSWPASYSSCIAVGATDYNDERVNSTNWGWGSNFGYGLDVAAPGVDITTSDISGSDGFNSQTNSAGDYYDGFNGTSSATPHASGVVALIYSILPGATVTQVRDILESTCDKVGGYSYSWTYPNGTWSQELGFGRINAYAAVQAAYNIAHPAQLNVHVDSPSELCYAPLSFPQLMFTVSGGTPFTNQSPHYYQYKACNSASYTNCSSDISNCYGHLIENSSTYVPIDFNYGTPPSFPYTQTYYFDIWDDAGLHQHIPVSVTINAKPVINGVTTPIQICSGSSVSIGPNINVTGGTNSYTYTWSPSINLTSTSILNPTAQNVPTSNTLYTLIVADANGCLTTATTLVTAKQIAIDAGADKYMCYGNPGPMNATITSPGFLPYSYTWSPGNYLSATNTLNPTITPPNTTAWQVYSVTVTDAKGCTASDLSMATFSNIHPQVSTNMNIQGCPGAPANLNATVTNGFSPYTAAWTSGTTTYPGNWNSNIYTSVVSPMTTTNYQFTVSDIYGCSTTVGPVNFVVNPSWGPTVNAGPDVRACHYTGVTLNGNASAGLPPYTYSWSPGNNSSQSYHVNDGGILTYTLTVTDDNGCVGTDQVVVYGDDFDYDPSPFQFFLWDCICPGTAFQISTHNASVNSIYPGVNWPTGGTTPYTYNWQPANIFVDNTLPLPYTVPIYSDQCLSFTVTDARGCSYNYPYYNDFFIDVVEHQQPSITVSNPVCSSEQACLTIHNPYPQTNGFYILPCNAGSTSQAGMVSTALHQQESITYDIDPDEWNANCFTYNNPGTHTVYYSSTDDCGTYTASAVITVNQTDGVSPFLYRCNSLVTNGNGRAIDIYLGMDYATLQVCATTLAPSSYGEFIGGNSIHMYPGCSVRYGSTFKAHINPCLYDGSDRSLEAENNDIPIPDSNINLYPNPNHGQFTIELNSDQSFLTEIQMIDMTGKKIYSQVISISEGTNRFSINQDQAPAGIYFVKINGIDQVIKMVITKTH
jgi:subtilisin family serine protease